MSKKYPFTRTISKQTVTALIFDKVNAEPMNTTITIAPPIVDAAKLEKAVAKKIDNDTYKLIEIVDTFIEDKVYGITLDDFIAHAVELNPETRKPITE